MIADDAKVGQRLFRSEHVVDYGMDHREQAVGQAGGGVAGMEKVVGFSSLVEIGKSRQDIVHDEHALELTKQGGSHLFKLHRALHLSQVSEGGGERDVGLIVECHGPRAAETLAHVGLHRLERVVPITVTVSREGGAFDDAVMNQIKGAVDMILDACHFGGVFVSMEKRQGFIKDSRVTRG